MAFVKEMVEFLNAELMIDRFKDYCPNGLQVQGKDEVQKVVTAVTASLAVVRRSVELGADVLLVHHGYFWKSEDQCIAGMKRARIKCLLENDVNLLAYHLPLDAHPEYGNNAQFAKILGIAPSGTLGGEAELVGVGSFKKKLPASELAQLISVKLNREPLHIKGKIEYVRKLAWCTGGAQNYFKNAIDDGVDAYISGEVSEQNYHLAKESGVHYFAAGHHATERYGVQAVGELLSRKFAVEHVFVDENNPV